MSFLELLDSVNERLQTDGQEPIAFDPDCREGICGSCGVMINGQAARAAARHRDLPAAPAPVRRRRHARRRAVALRGVPRDPGPRRRPQRVRPHHRGRRLHQRRHGRGGRRQPDRGPQGRRRPRDGRRGLHRLRRLRRGLPQRRRPALHRGQARAPQPAAPGPAGAPGTRTRRWSTRWRRFFGSCTNHRECAAACPKEISIDFIAMMNRDYLKSKFRGKREVSAEGFG